MGGMDWQASFDARDRPLVEAIRAAGRRRSRRLDVRWRSCIADDVVTVVVDGRWWLIDLLLARLARDLPLLCEGVDVAHRSPEARRGLGRSFAHIAAQHRFAVPDRMPEGWVPRLRARGAEPWSTAPFIFECPGAPDLEPRLEITERIIVDWEFGEVASDTLIEELHTAAELVLKRVNHGRHRRQGSFSEEVALAETNGALNLPSVYAVKGSIRARAHNETRTPSELLVELNRVRVDSKHRGVSRSEDWLEKWGVGAGEVLQHLASKARTAPSRPAH